MYQAFLIATLLTALLSWVLAIIVFFRNSQSLASNKWSLTCLAVGIWSYALFGLISSNNDSIALFWQLMLHIGVAFIPALFLDFVIELLQQKKFVLAKVMAYVGGMLILVLNFQGGLIGKVAPIASMSDFPYWLIAGPWYWILPIYFISTILFSIYLLIGALYSATGFRRKQLGYILFATVIGFLAGSTNFLPQLYGVYPFGNFFTWIYVVVISFYLIKIDIT